VSAASTPPTAPAARAWPLALLIASLSMLGPLSVDAYLPAFPVIGAELQVSPIAVQQSLSIYLFAFAFMMLWHGALADALGRRSVVLAGLAVYAVSSLGCAIAGNIQTLWLFRAIQGLCSGSGMVIGRAIVRDRYHGAEAQKLMAQITLFFGVAPAVAPVLGGVLLNALGWRSIFWTMFVLTVALLAWSVKSLPETLPPDARQSLAPRQLWRNYVAVLRHRDYLLLALMPALNFAAFFLYISSAPTYLVDRLGVSTYGFAWLFVPMIGGIMIGAAISGRLAGRLAPAPTVRVGYLTMAAGVVLQLAVAWFVPPGVPWHVLPIGVFTVGSAIVTPTAQLLMLDLFPGMRGMASSLQGFFHFALAGVVAGTIAPLLASSVQSLALGMAMFALGGWTLWLTYRRGADRLESEP
jgi:DHA1 family bicyclomycin/chloramphenicol resistance-like MFS transporter